MMDALSILGSALGLGFLSGFRLYFTVAALGLAVKYDLFRLTKEMASLHVLADWKVIGVAGALGAVEFLADKIPWVDSMWDSVHTVVRPLAAGALALTALGDMDPFVKTVLALLSGSVALSTHSAKAATRLAVNHSPEPFSNIALSLAEDIAAPAGIWLVMQYPVVAAAFVGVFLLGFAVIAPGLFRLMRMEAAALRGVLRNWFGAADAAPAMPAGVAAHAGMREAWRASEGVIEGRGVYCAATGSVKGLKRSTGWLQFGEQGMAFVTRRMFRERRHEIPAAEIRGAKWKSGLFLDELTVVTRAGDVSFDVFKSAERGRAAVQDARLETTARS